MNKCFTFGKHLHNYLHSNYGKNGNERLHEKQILTCVELNSFQNRWYNIERVCMPWRVLGLQHKRQHCVYIWETSNGKLPTLIKGVTNRDKLGEKCVVIFHYYWLSF